MRRHSLLNLLHDNAGVGSFKAEANTIWVYDVIVGSELEAEWFGGIAPTSFIEALRGMTGTVNVRINSPGGDVFGATAMAQAMREYDGEIVTHVDGMAASAASIIAVMGSKVVMAPGALMMIHNAWTIALGDRHDMLDMSALLEKVDGQIAQTYATRSGGDVAAFAALMDAETWLTPEEAVKTKLADEIAPDKPKSAQARWKLDAFANAPAVAHEPAVRESLVPDPKHEIEARGRRHAAAMLSRAA